MKQAGFNRRDFLKYNLFATLWAASGMGLFWPRLLLAKSVPDIGVAKGAPAAATRAAVRLLGGMGRFVKPGNKVVIKPNMSWDSPVAWGTNTHPEVVRELVVMCKQAGAAQVQVIDHTINDAKQCLKDTGIKAACDSVQEGIITAINDSYQFQDQKVPGGEALKKTEVAKAVLESDVLIVAPVAKTHMATSFTLSLKGMMGLVHNRIEMHMSGLDDAIVDVCSIVKADLTVIDVSRYLSNNGPMGPGKVIEKKMVIAARDMVAADAYAVSNLEWHGTRLQPSEVAHIRKAHERGLGTMEIGKLSVKKVAA